jgi:hypothetical protein
MDDKRFALLALIVFVLGCSEDPKQAERAMSPEEQLYAALEEPVGIARTAGLVAAIDGLDTPRAKRFAVILDEWEGGTPAYELMLLHSTWAARDADAALEFILLRDPEARHHPNLAAQVVKTVASREPAKARSWVMSIPDDAPQALRIALILGLVEGWPASQEGFAGISELIQSVPSGFERDRAVRVLVTGLVRDGQLEETMRWAESIPLDAPSNFRALAFRKIADAAGEDTPMVVSDWLDGHREFRYGQAGIRILARAWARRDPEAALEWALAQPDDRGRFLAIKFAFQQYYDDEPERAGAWLAARPDTDPLDTARMTYALSHTYVDSEEAADEALKIENEAVRDDTLNKVMKHWFRVDSGAARAWMDASGLPESYWDSLRRAPQPMQPSPHSPRK